MIFTLLGLLGLGLWGAHATGYDVSTGVQCKLCGWKYRVGERYSYDASAREEAARLFELHLRDAHPSVAEELLK